MILSHRFLFVSLSIVLVAGSVQAEDATKVLSIGKQKQLFIDDAIIDSTNRVNKTLHKFRRHPDNPLMVPEKPWERSNFVYGSVLRDPQTGLFRMWFTNSGTRVHTRDDRQFGVQLCYATSRDGLHWERPSLGVVEIDGSKENNVVAVNAGGGYLRGASVVYNSNGTDPARRYVHLNQTPDGTAPSYSADGIQWSEGEPPVFEASDAATLSYDPRQDRFFCSSVSMPRVRGFVRRSIEMTPTDLRIWREFKTVLVADEIDDAGTPARIERLRSILDYDNPDHYHAQLHHMAAFPYESITLGILTLWDNLWYTEKEPLFAGGRDRALIQLQLAWTRDPEWWDWQRLDQRVSLLELSEPGEWDCAVQMPLGATVKVGDELRLYYSGFARSFNCPATHGLNLPVAGKVPANGIGVASMRLDGFASLDAGPRGGTVITKPFTFEGSNLKINARALGQVTVDILDANGEPIKGFGPVSVAGDSVRHSASWDNLDELAERPVRLRFRMWNAQLYAFAWE